MSKTGISIKSIDKSIALGSLGAVMTTGALLALSGTVGLVIAVTGCALSTYSLRYPQHVRQHSRRSR